MTCVASRAGALENLEIVGTLFLLVSDSDFENIAIKITDNKQAQTSVSLCINVRAIVDPKRFFQDGYGNFMSKFHAFMLIS